MNFLRGVVVKMFISQQKQQVYSKTNDQMMLIDSSKIHDS